MKANLLILIIILIFAPLANAGKLYKIVDENGRVTFSQVPPRKGEEPTATVEEMKVDSGAKTRVTTEFGNEYCGEIRLPSNSDHRGSSSKYYTREVTNSLEGWKESLANISANRQRSDRQTNQYSRYYSDNSRYQNQQIADYQEQYSRDTQRIRDLRCAIDWAENKQDKIAEYEATDEAEKARLLGIARQLETDMENKCGKQPEFDPTNPSNEYTRKRWYNCSSDLMRDLKKVHQRINRL